MKIAEGKLVPTHNTFLLAQQDRIHSAYIDWTEEHSLQGFSWVPGRIMYALIGNPLSVKMAVETCDNCDEDISELALRVIRLPFEVPERADLVVFTLEPNVTFSLPPGQYMVQYEYWGNGYVEDDAFARLRFCPGTADPAILRADPYMKVPPSLRLEGWSASSGSNA